MSIATSDSGLCIVLDSKNNVRMYDVFHGEKVLKLIPG